MTGPLHVLLLASLLGLLHSQLVPVDNEEYLDDVDEIIEENLDDYYPDDIGKTKKILSKYSLIISIRSSDGEKVRLSVRAEGQTEVSDTRQDVHVQTDQHQEAGTDSKSWIHIFVRTKREFLDELRECRDQIFDAPIKRIKLLENQARVKNVLHSVRTKPSDATFTFS